jgi:CRISPR-associated protein Cmr3
LVGPPGGTAPFEIGPPLLAWRQERRAQVYYPTPRDLVCLKADRGPRNAGSESEGEEQDVSRLALLRPLEPPEGVSHCLGPLRPVGIASPERIEEFKARFVSLRALEACLSGECPAEDALASQAPRATREPRIGIGIDATTRAAETGRLYLRDVVRLEKDRVEAGRSWWVAGLLVTTSEDLGLDGTVARLGGDGRMARITAVEVPDRPSRPEVGVRLKVYLAAPTWFRGPDEAGSWHPGWLDSERLEGAPPGCPGRVRLVGAAVGALMPAGGWDLAAQEPRAIQWLVPPGTVYFFEAAGVDDARAVAEALHGRPLCDDATMARAGFGLAFVGRW